MSNPERALREIFDHLHAHGVAGALIGGLAVSVHTEPRFTRDVDVAVAVRDDAEAERLVFALQRAGYNVLSQLEHEPTRRLSTVRLCNAIDVALLLVSVQLSSLPSSRARSGRLIASTASCSG